MRSVFVATIIGCALTILPIATLKLRTDSALVESLKWVSTNLTIPGGFVGLIASGSRIDDISLRISDLANFLFYFVLAYVLLMIWTRLKSKFGGASPIAPAGRSAPSARRLRL